MVLKLDSVLEEYAQRAYEFSINLDGRVERSPTFKSRGGFALVYKGTLIPDGIEVAVKTPISRFSGNETGKIIKDTVREVHAWSKLRHKNVLPLLGVTTEFDHIISIVSAWMEKGDAHHYVQDQNVDPRPLIEGIARGLLYLHNYKPGSIFHGDLKGSNVLISQERNALLTDFGLSRVVDSSLRITRTDMCGGSLNWMAPEHLDSGEVSAEADVWAFGMTAMELFTRKIPFHNRLRREVVMAAIIRGPPTRPSEDETLTRLTNDWWEICLSCWNRQPVLRPKMSAIVKSISAVASDMAAEENRALKISGIEIRNVNESDSAEVAIGGQCYKISGQREGGVIRADFDLPLESPIQDQFSLFITSQGSGWNRRVELSFDARDVLSKSEKHIFRRVHDRIEVILEISPSAGLDLLIPTTDELLQICPHFRILIIGKTGVGKSSLIHRTFGVDEAHTANDKRGKAKIEKPLVSKLNKRFILHDSLGFEPGEHNNIALVKSFIERRKTHEDVKEQLHAVWLSFQIPLETYGQRMMETGMEDFLRDKRNILGDIPTVFVFTKYDKLIDEIEIRWTDQGREYTESEIEAEAERYLKKHCIEPIKRLTGEHDFPYLAVSMRAHYHERLKQLVQLTYQKVADHFVQHQGSGPSAVTTVTVMAQRMDSSLNIAASIIVGKRRYWEAVSQGSYFLGHINLDCLQVIHTDIIKVWNFCDPSEILTSQEFRESISLFEESNSTPGWTTWLYRREPDVQRKFIAYIVDLTHVMDVLFMLTDGKNDQELTPAIIREAIHAYRESAKRKNTHAKVKTFYGTVLGSGGDLASGIGSLISPGCNDDENLHQRIEKARGGKKPRKRRL